MKIESQTEYFVTFFFNLYFLVLALSGATLLEIVGSTFLLILVILLACESFETDKPFPFKEIKKAQYGTSRPTELKIQHLKESTETFKAQTEGTITSNAVSVIPEQDAELIKPDLKNLFRTRRSFSRSIPVDGDCERISDMDKCLMKLRNGWVVTKFSREGYGKRRKIYIDEEGSEIFWYSFSRKGFPLGTLLDVVDKRANSFTLVFQTREIDLTCVSLEEKELMFKGFQKILEVVQEARKQLLELCMSKLDSEG